MADSRTPSPLEAIARLRTMRALLTGEDRDRFERLVGEVEEAVCDTEALLADFARVAARGVLKGVTSPAAPVELTDVVASALRSIDSLLTHRGVMIDVDAPSPVFVFGDRERLEHLVIMALTIAIRATPSRRHAQLKYAREETVVAMRLAPYFAADPREPIIDALAQSQGVEVEVTEDALLLLLPTAPADALEIN